MTNLTKEPNCRNCWDKGYSTVYEGYNEAPKVHKKFCTCKKGKRLQSAERKPL